MVIVLKKDVTEEQLSGIRSFLAERKFKLNVINGSEETVIAAVGKMNIDSSEVGLLPGVGKIIPISKPYKMASREFKKENTVAEVSNGKGQIIRVGGQRIVAIAGPAVVESREQIMGIAEKVSQSGAVMLRAAGYKPRTSPYSFHGLGEEGFRYLKEAGEKYALPVVSEIVSEELVPMMQDYVDVYQIGARNMQDFALLKKVGTLGKPVILKRSHSATLEEFLMSAEYLLSSGAENVILCERGIRTFEHSTKNTLDLSSIPLLRSLTHLPIIVDPCHSVGVRDAISSMSLASIACGADGIVVSVHDHPEKALSGGSSSMMPSQFDKLMHDVEAICPVVGKAVAHIRQEPTAGKNSGTISMEKTAGKISCAYSGKKGAYAEQAISLYFDSKEVDAIPVDSFSEIFQAVIDGKIDYGMVPIENSLAGSVYQNYDNFSRFEDVSIVGAVTLNIRHSLLVKPGTKLEDIKTVQSHPQALAQCRKFLDGNKDWTLVDSVSTATAAQNVSKSSEKDCAAIGSRRNADLYGLEILREDIEDDAGNFTRFVVIQANHLEGKEKGSVINVKPDTASYIFTTKNEPGALYNVLGAFQSLNLNLTRLESRPIAGQPWKYWFYADLDLSGCEDAEVQVAKVNEVLKEKAFDVRLLGMYSEANH